MQEVEARLDIEVFVDCPKCGYLIDLMKEEDTDGHCHNEEANVISQACPDGCWHEEREKFSIKNVTCSKCKTDFNVKGLQW